jgi:hypothetical protein
VQADEFVGVALRLLAGGQLLPGVLHQARRLAFLFGEGVGGLEADFLLRQLVLDVVVGEVRVAREHEPGDEQQSGEDDCAEAGHDIDRPALHGGLPVW